MNDDKEREVSIGEVFLNIFKHWKIIVVAVIIGTVLLGGYSYYKKVYFFRRQSYSQKKGREDGTDTWAYDYP